MSVKSAVELQTKLGRIRGVSESGGFAFLGIPYAAPPVGTLRWRRPEPAPPWKGVLDATQYPDRCFQPPMPASLDLGEIPGELSEDCLYLNVFTPAIDNAKRPVLVWIHGGGFIQGSANDLDPSHFARQNDIVVVAMNYRLGMLGFLDLRRFGGEFDTSPAHGLLDQMMALQWVQNHVEDFGGDAGRVTVSGVSAGGGSVLALMSAPSAKGLFHQAISISPGEISRTPPDVVTPYAAALDISPEAFFERLRTDSASAVFNLQTEANLGGLAAVDGTLIHKPAHEAIRAGANPVPLLVGSTINEGPMLTELFPDEAEVIDFFIAGIAGIGGNGDPDRFVAYIRESTEGGSARDRLNATWNAFFRSSALHGADALAELGMDSWVYRWEVPTDHPLGPTHGSDVIFAFDGMSPLRDPGKMLAFYRNTPVNRDCSAVWSRTMANFIRNGDPTWVGLPDWPVYDRERRTTLRFGARPVLVEELDTHEQLTAFGLA